MKSKLILIIIFFSYSILHSQENKNKEFYSLNGKIIDSSTNKTLPYVNIALLSIKDSAFVKTGISNKDGEFQINKLDTNSYILRVNYIGYIPMLKNVNIEKESFFNLQLIKTDTELEEVTISGNKEIYKLETDKRIYLTANDESIQNAFAEDAVENAPGVFIDIDGNVMIRDKPASIWINGKPSKKKGGNLRSYLKLLPASRIEKIEVITNPSARYTATNTNSIVNIVLKKQTNKNSLFAIGTVINTDGTFGLFSSAYITKKKFDINLYATASTSSRNFKYYDKSYSLNNNDTSFFSEFIQEENFKHKHIEFYSEFNYHINKNTDIGLNVEYSNLIITNIFSNENIRRFDNEKYLQISLNKKNHYEYFYTNLNFNHNFSKEGHTISFDVYAYNDKPKLSFNKNKKDLLNNLNTYWQFLGTEKDISIEINLDYSYPINKKHTFSTGFYINPISYNSSDNIIETSINNETWFTDSILSNKYVKEIPSYEMYSTFSGEMSSFNYKLGLRYERQIYNIEQSIPVYNKNKEYSFFYPSVHISYETKLKHNFSLSYSKRVNTPIYNLNPYIDRTNNDYISSGNPDLDFASTNSYELTYFKRFDKINITTSIYQKNTKNVIIKVSKPVYDSYFKQTVVLQTYANCADSKFTGTEISLSSSPIKKLKLRLYTNTYYQDLNGTYNNLPLVNKSFIYSAKFTASYKFFNKFIVNITPYYKSSKSDIFHFTNSNVYTNARLKFDLWNKRLSIDIKARDIFGTREMISEYYLDNFYHYSEKDYNFQRVQFVAIFRIGNSKFDRQAKINKLAR